MSSSNSSGETKRAFGWLVAAVLFFALILWWKSDKIFGDGTPDSPPANVYTPIRSDDPNAPRIAVTVVDDKTGKPLADARVMILSRSAERLGDEVTSSSGSTELRPTKTNIHGVVAWHKDYEIRATLATSGPIEIRLRPITFLAIDIGERYPARKAWFAASDAGVKLKYSRSTTFNPMQAKEDYLEFKMCEYLGLNNKKWPMDSDPIRIPRYLRIRGKLYFVTGSEFSNHLETRGMRDQHPPSLAGKETVSEPVEAYTNVQSVKMKAPPSSPHAFVGRYRRQEEDKGILMVHLRQLDRDPRSPTYGDTITINSEFSTYEEDGGTATFRVFGLHKTIVYPTILVFPPSGPRKTIRCNPVEIDGLTETELKPLEYGKLTIKTGRRVDIQLLDDHLEPVINAGPENLEDDGKHWSQIEPTVYRVVSQTETHSTPLLTVRIAPGEHKIVHTKLMPACRVTLVYKQANAPAAFLVRDKATGAEHGYDKELFTRHFLTKVEGKGDATILRLTGHRHELFLPHGDYEFVRVEKGGANGKTILVTIKGTVQDVILD